MLVSLKLWVSALFQHKYYWLFLPTGCAFMWGRCSVVGCCPKHVLPSQKLRFKCLLPWTNCFLSVSGSNPWLIPSCPRLPYPTGILRMPRPTLGHIYSWELVCKEDSSHANVETQKPRFRLRRCSLESRYLFVCAARA